MESNVILQLASMHPKGARITRKLSKILENQIRIYRKLSKILKSINIVRISSEVISSACPDGFFIELQATVEVSLGKICPGN